MNHYPVEGECPIRKQEFPLPYLFTAVYLMTLMSLPIAIRTVRSGIDSPCMGANRVVVITPSVGNFKSNLVGGFNPFERY